MYISTATAFGALDLVGQVTHSSIELAGKRYIDLGSVAGLTYRIDPARQELVLDIAPTALAGTKTALKLGSSLRPRRPDWGGFANYTVFGYADRGNNFGPGSQYLSGAGEVAVFGPYGTGLISAIANPSVFGYGEQAKLVRLDTNWRYDDIDKMRTLIVGDAISLPGSWGRAVRYGGVQYSSNYSPEVAHPADPRLAREDPGRETCRRARIDDRPAPDGPRTRGLAPRRDRPRPFARPARHGSRKGKGRPVVLDEFYSDGKDLFGSIEIVDGRWGASLRIDLRADGRKSEQDLERPAPLLLFDLERDPHALRSLHAERPDLVKKYSKTLSRAWRENLELGRHFTRPGARPMRPEEIERLRTLGYLR